MNFCLSLPDIIHNSAHRAQLPINQQCINVITFLNWERFSSDEDMSQLLPQKLNNGFRQASEFSRRVYVSAFNLNFEKFG